MAGMCKIPGCKKPVQSRGTMCSMHYKRQSVHGSPHVALKLHNPAPGQEREMRRDGKIDMFVFRPGHQRQSLRGWVKKSIIVYERCNKDHVNPGECVLFVDGDKRNFSPCNLII